MSRQLVAKAELEDLLLHGVRRHSGCEQIARVYVAFLGDLRFDVNWKLERIDYGPVALTLAGRAAHLAQEKLRSIYLLERAALLAS